MAQKLSFETLDKESRKVFISYLHSAIDWICSDAMEHIFESQLGEIADFIFNEDAEDNTGA